MEDNEFAYGSIIGACLGDALGAVLEFIWPYPQDAVDKAFTLPGGGKLRLGEGQFTDDSEMAMCQINALKNKKPSDGFPIEDLLNWYRKWAGSGPFDMGITTTMALVTKTHQTVKEHIERVKKVNIHSKANGSMMRMTPLCVWSRKIPIDKRVECFRLDSQLTHPNPSVLDSCCAYGIAVSSLVNNSGNTSETLSIVSDWLMKNGNQEVQDWFKESEMENLGNFKVYPQAAFVRWGFTLAFYFLRNEIDYKTAIEQTLLLGGDTDTNAAIVGGMVGARVGKTGLPRNLVDKMLGFEFKKGDTKGHIRPEYLSPKNLELWISELIQTTE